MIHCGKDTGLGTVTQYRKQEQQICSIDSIPFAHVSVPKCSNLSHVYITRGAWASWIRLLSMFMRTLCNVDSKTKLYVSH